MIVNEGGGGGKKLPTLTSPASASQILTGRQAIDQLGAILTGSMVNHGAVSQSLNAGGSYTIPAGYHNGIGRVNANSLASQTSASAVAADIRSGKTAWVNGAKLVGNSNAIDVKEINHREGLYNTGLRLDWTRSSRIITLDYSSLYSAGYPNLLMACGVIDAEMVRGEGYPYIWFYDPRLIRSDADLGDVKLVITAAPRGELDTIQLGVESYDESSHTYTFNVSSRFIDGDGTGHLDGKGVMLFA